MTLPQSSQAPCSGTLCGLIFDIDGVLFDSRAANIDFYNLIRCRVNLPPLTPEEEIFCHMASAEQVLRGTIPLTLQEQALIVAEGINYQALFQSRLIPEEGLLEALYWLHSWEIPMAICTNRSNSAHSLLHGFGMEKFFPIIKTVHTCSPKPDPQGLLEIMQEWRFENSSVAFLGDSPTDAEAARAAGIPFWAFRNKSLQAEMHFSDFFEFIKGITPFVENKTIHKKSLRKHE